MAEFRMPALGADMTEGTLLEWLVHSGDEVHRGDIVAVVDTDKAAIEIECFNDGVVGELLVQPGTKVAVGTALATIRDGAAGPVAVPSPPAVESPLVRHLAHTQGIDLQSVHATGPDGLITRSDVLAASTPPPAPVQQGNGHTKVSPYARRRAAELGVDLAQVVGSGPEGTVTADDVAAALGRPSAHERALPERSESAPVPAAQHSDATARSAAMRRAVGDLMARSKRDVPHYYLSTTVDMGGAVDWLRMANASRTVEERLVPAALLLKACALAARKVPNLNGWWVDDGFQPSESVHLGVAVSLRPSGLVAPAILDADSLDLEALMVNLRDLVIRARQGRLRGREMSDGTLTVTNLGDNGADAVYGVIYPPQVALVGIGRLREAAVARNGLVGARPCVTVTLSADHRVTDGHEGSRFLAAVDTFLQTPEKL